MKKKNIRQTKGITLIALVITIIVMLILVGVTISIAVNGGLFDYARKATKTTEAEINREKKLADLESNMSTEALIDYFTTEPDIHNWTRGTGDKIDTFYCSHCDTELTMGDVINYTPTSASAVTVLGTESGKTDNPVNQTIAQETNLTWVVFGLDKNNSLLITTSEPVGLLYLYGKKSYANGPSIVNNICKKLYSNSTYGKARSMTIEDVNRAVNWTDTRGMVWPTGGGTPYKVNAGTKFGDVELTTGDGKMKSADWDAIKNNNQTPEEGKALTDYEINGYYYMVEDHYLVDATNTSSTNNPITSIEESVVFGSSSNMKVYWLASCGVRASGYNSFAGFGPGYVRDGTVCLHNRTFHSNGSENGDGFGLRPVVPLKSEIPD